MSGHSKDTVKIEVRTAGGCEVCNRDNSWDKKIKVSTTIPLSNAWQLAMFPSRKCTLVTVEANASKRVFVAKLIVNDKSTTSLHNRP